MNPGNDVPWELPPEYHDEPDRPGHDCLNCGMCESCIDRSIAAAEEKDTVERDIAAALVGEGFRAFARERFAVSDRGTNVRLLPDPLGGSFSTSMSPEQAEYLSAWIAGLAAAARKARHEAYPLLYPEDAP
jgi:hypothetical protein